MVETAEKRPTSTRQDACSRWSVLASFSQHFHALGGCGLRAEISRGALGSLAVKMLGTALSLAAAVLLGRALGPGGYGVFVYTFAIVGLLAIPATLGLPTLLLRLVASYQIQKKWALLRGLLVRSEQIVLSASLGIVTLTAAAVWLAFPGTGSLQIHVLLWALVALPFAVLAVLRRAALLGLRHAVLAQLPDDVTRPGLFILAAAGVYLTAGSRVMTPPLAAAIHAGCTVVAFAAGAAWLRRKLPAAARSAPASFDDRLWFRSAVPLFLFAALEVVAVHLDAVMLGLLATPEDVGIYRIAASGSALVSFFLVSANMVLAPHFARLHADGAMERLQHLVTASVRVILVASLPGTLLLVAYGGPILGAIFGPQFERGHTALAILCLGQFVNLATGSVGTLLNMTGHEVAATRALAIALATNLILNLLLIPVWRIEGAAVATASSVTMLNVILWAVVLKRLGIHPTALGRLTIGD